MLEPLRPVVCAAISCLVLVADARAQAPQVEVDSRIPFATRRIIHAALDAPDVQIATGSTVVAADETRAGAIVQLGGSLLLAGRVEGDVTAVDSEVTLRPGARIGGRLTVLAGRLYGSSLADVGKGVTWLRGERVVVSAADTVRILYVPPERPFPIGPKGLFGLVIHEYNRVDGLAFGAELGLRELKGQPPTELRGGPVFRSARLEDVGWRLAGSREIPRLAAVTIGGGAHSVTDTEQRWHRRDLANSVSAFLFANDDRAYHERTGYELWLERAWVLEPVSLRLGWRDDAFDALTSETPFVLFGGDEDWPANPVVEEGDGRALGVMVRWDRRTDPGSATAGAFLEAHYEHWGFGGDFAFDRGRIDGRGYLPLAGASFATLRIAAAGRLGGGDTLAPQFLYRLGGIGSVIGYDGLDPRLAGDRAAFANLRLFLAVPGGGFLEKIYVVGLADVGDAWFPDESVRWNTGLGAGLASRGRFIVGAYGAYGLESEEWHAYVVFGPWF